jgi:hypothetical protein
MVSGGNWRVLEKQNENDQRQRRKPSGRVEASRLGRLSMNMKISLAMRNGKPCAVDAEPACYGLVVHRAIGFSSGRWTVSDPVTGRSVVTAVSEQDAVDRADARLSKIAAQRGVTVKYFLAKWRKLHSQEGAA